MLSQASSSYSQSHDQRSVLLAQPTTPAILILILSRSPYFLFFGLCLQCCCVAQYTKIPGHTEAPLVPASTCLNLLKIGPQDALVNAPNPIAIYGVTKPVKTGLTGCFPQSLLVEPAVSDTPLKGPVFTRVFEEFLLLYPRLHPY